MSWRDPSPQKHKMSEREQAWSNAPEATEWWVARDEHRKACLSGINLDVNRGPDETRCRGVTGTEARWEGVEEHMVSGYAGAGFRSENEQVMCQQLRNDRRGGGGFHPALCGGKLDCGMSRWQVHGRSGK